MTAVWEILCTYDKDIFRSPPQSGGERFKQRNPPPAAGGFLSAYSSGHYSLSSGSEVSGISLGRTSGFTPSFSSIASQSANIFSFSFS